MATPLATTPLATLVSTKRRTVPALLTSVCLLLSLVVFSTGNDSIVGTDGFDTAGMSKLMELLNGPGGSEATEMTPQLLNDLQVVADAHTAHLAVMKEKVKTARVGNRHMFKQVHRLLDKQAQNNLELGETPLAPANGDNRPPAALQVTNGTKKKPVEMRRGSSRIRPEVMQLRGYVNSVKDSSFADFRRMNFLLWRFKNSFRRKQAKLDNYRQTVEKQQKTIEEYEIKIRNHMKGMRQRMKLFLSSADEIERGNTELVSDLSNDKILLDEYKAQLTKQVERVKELKIQLEKLMVVDKRLRREQTDFLKDLRTLKDLLKEVDPMQQKLWAQEYKYQKAGEMDAEHMRQLRMGISLLKRKQDVWKTGLTEKITEKLMKSKDLINAAIKRTGMLVETAREEAAQQMTKIMKDQLSDRIKDVEAELFEKEVADELKRQVTPALEDYLARQKKLQTELDRMKEAATAAKWEDPDVLFSESGQKEQDDAEDDADKATEEPAAGTPETAAPESPAPETTTPETADTLLQLDAALDDQGHWTHAVGCSCAPREGSSLDSGDSMHCYCV